MAEINRVNNDLYILERKITQGVFRAHRKLVEERIKNNGFMVIYENGKVVRKKARRIYPGIGKKRFFGIRFARVLKILNMIKIQS
jgi:hypothetical protein